MLGPTFAVAYDATPAGYGEGNPSPRELEDDGACSGARSIMNGKDEGGANEDELLASGTLASGKIV